MNTEHKVKTHVIDIKYLNYPRMINVAGNVVFNNEQT